MPRMTAVGDAQKGERCGVFEERKNATNSFQGFEGLEKV